MSSRAAAMVATVGICAVVSSSCARAVNTPAQEVAWRRWSACRQEVPGADLGSIQADGRISFWYNGAGEGQSMLACLHRAAEAGPLLPEPIADLRPGGSGGGGGAM